MADPYRFGGPIPESVQRMKKRREWRASPMYALTMSKRRAERLANPPAGWKRVCDDFGAVISLQPTSPSFCPKVPAGGESLGVPISPASAVTEGGLLPREEGCDMSNPPQDKAEAATEYADNSLGVQILEALGIPSDHAIKATLEIAGGELPVITVHCAIPEGFRKPALGLLRKYQVIPISSENLAPLDSYVSLTTGARSFHLCSPTPPPHCSKSCNCPRANDSQS